MSQLMGYSILLTCVPLHLQKHGIERTTHKYQAIGLIKLEDKFNIWFLITLNQQLINKVT